MNTLFAVCKLFWWKALILYANEGRNHLFLMHYYHRNDNLLDFLPSPIFMAFPREMLNYVMLGLLGGEGTTYCLVMSSKFLKWEELPTKQVSKWFAQPNQKILIFSQRSNQAVSMQICNSGLAKKCWHSSGKWEKHALPPKTLITTEKFNSSRLQNTIAHDKPLSPKSEQKVPSVEVAIMPSPSPNPPQQ